MNSIVQGRLVGSQPNNSLQLKNQEQKKQKIQEQALCAKLFKFLIFIGKKENIIEAARQKLCSHPQFETRQLFDRLAGVGRSGLLTADRLFEFMQSYPQDSHRLIDSTTPIDRNNENVDNLGSQTNSNTASASMPFTKKQAFLLCKMWESRADQGALSLTDFNSITLPKEDSLLRAEVAQRPMSLSLIPDQVEKAFSQLIYLECQLLESVERQKRDMEKTGGYSVQSLFNMLDVYGYKYLSSASFYAFMNENSQDKHPKWQPTERRMQSMLRRIGLEFNGRITFSQFAQLIRPYSIDAYMERIECNRTKDRKSQLDTEKVQNGQTQSRNQNLQKPLTAFDVTNTMLDKDPNRDLYPFDNQESDLQKTKTNSQALTSIKKGGSIRKKLPAGQYSTKIGHVNIPCDQRTAQGMASVRSKGSLNSNKIIQQSSRSYRPATQTEMQNRNNMVGDTYGHSRTNSNFNKQSHGSVSRNDRQLLNQNSSVMGSQQEPDFIQRREMYQNSKRSNFNQYCGGVISENTGGMILAPVDQQLKFRNMQNTQSYKQQTANGLNQDMSDVQIQSSGQHQQQNQQVDMVGIRKQGHQQDDGPGTDILSNQRGKPLSYSGHGDQVDSAEEILRQKAIQESREFCDMRRINQLQRPEGALYQLTAVPLKVDNRRLEKQGILHE